MDRVDRIEESDSGGVGKFGEGRRAVEQISGASYLW